MTEKNQRIQRIIQRTQKAFLLDSINKTEEIREQFKLWQSREISLEMLVEVIYRHVHGMKGLALTLSYEGVDALCRELLDLILQQDGQYWTPSELQRLEQLTNSLNREIGSLQIV